MKKKKQKSKRSITYIPCYNSTPTHSPKLISERRKLKKKRKEKKKRRESRDRTCYTRRERKRSEGTEDKGHGVNVGARQSA